MKDFAGFCHGCWHDFAFHDNQSVRGPCGLSGSGNRGKRTSSISGMRFILSRDEADSELNCALCTLLFSWPGFARKLGKLQCFPALVSEDQTWMWKATKFQNIHSNS